MLLELFVVVQPSRIRLPAKKQQEKANKDERVRCRAKIGQSLFAFDGESYGESGLLS